MISHDLLQIGLFLGLLTALTPPLGGYMAKVYEGKSVFLSFTFRPLERFLCHLIGGDPEKEMNWKAYLGALLWFNALGFCLLFLILLCQGCLPLNPQNFAGLSVPLAFNTAVSFMTNTNWQAYSGESALSYFSQMVGLTTQNFASAATGMCVLVALIRGLGNKSVQTLGNFWVDLIRGTLYILLPLSVILAVILASQGVIQNFSPYIHATTIEGAQQILPMGPAASQIAIKQIGTNGGGFFGVNSAHPFENPTPLSNFLELLSILLIPAALTFTYGKMVRDVRQGWVLFAAMFILLVGFFAVAWWAEAQPNVVLPMSQNMEGKETRFGVMNSTLWAISTTAASNGSVNAMHDSLSPIAGGLAMLNIMLGEIVFGGVGAGLYGMLKYVLLTVFLAGLIVGRTPEYLGKKIEAREVRWAVAAILVPSALILIGSAIACILPAGLSSLANNGPHGLSEILYAFASASGNNGSAFAGLSADTSFYNYALGFCMLVGRFIVIVPALAIAGSMGVKKTSPPGPGTFPTTGVTFVVLLVSVILILGALTFFPSLTLGPIIEHYLMLQGRTF
ncbi:MAG: potassium-transporting ATPase subunit KdpA [Chthoniobacterales bacterium]